MRSALRKAAFVAASTCAVALFFSNAAYADPEDNGGDGTVDTNDIVGVGSDTTQFVINDLAEAYNATSPTDELYSWDATPAEMITTKEGCDPIDRPNGSSDGVDALQADGTAHCIDFARSSRGPRADEDDLSFVQFARDALAIAYDADSTTVPDSFTTLELNILYASDAGDAECDRTIFVPQGGSGTRGFFLDSIGLDDDTIGTCATEVQEHDASPLVANPEAIAPFSVGRGVPFFLAGDIDLADVDDSERPVGLPANTVVTVDKNDAQTTDVQDPVVAYDRAIYNVLRDADVNLAKYRALFNSLTGWICINSTARNIVQNVHFFRLSPQCGVVAPSV